MLTLQDIWAAMKEEERTGIKDAASPAGLFLRGAESHRQGGDHPMDERFDDHYEAMGVEIDVHPLGPGRRR